MAEGCRVSPTSKNFTFDTYIYQLENSTMIFISLFEIFQHAI